MIEGVEMRDNPYGYNALTSQQNFFAHKADFGFLAHFIEETNLGSIRELICNDSGKVNFVLSLPNRVVGNMHVTYGEHDPIYLFSSFYESYQCGEVAKDMSKGTNLGWQILDGDWVREAFSIYEADDIKVEKPYGYTKIDRTRVVIDHSTTILIRSYDNLPYRRLAISLRFHKVEGFVSEILITGVYEKNNYQSLLHGIILLLQDAVEMKKEGKKVLKTIDKNIKKQLKDMGGDMTTEDMQKYYSDIINFVFRDENMEDDDVDYSSIRSEGGEKTMFIPDKKEPKE